MKFINMLYDILFVVMILLITCSPEIAEGNDCGYFERNINDCYIIDEMKIKCQKNLGLKGGDIIETSISIKELGDSILFDYAVDHKIEVYANRKYRIYCKTKTANGIWGSIKEVYTYKKEKLVNPYFYKKQDQAKYVITRGEGGIAPISRNRNKPIDKQRWVLIPGLLFSIKNLEQEPCEVEIIDYSGEKKINKVISSGNVFQVNPDDIKMKFDEDYIFKRSCGNSVESAIIILKNDEIALDIKKVMADIDNDKSYADIDKNALKIIFLNRMSEYYKDYQLQWLIDYYESQ